MLVRLLFIIENILRDFNHEEKGEEIDDLEPKMEEKEKVTKPRGWNKESVGKDDQQKPKKENPKKKKSQNLEKNEKSGKNPKLPTADGSRQSRLDKENAEKEVANKNVWAERMSKQKKEDTDNDVSNVGCVFSVVVWSDSRMGQYRDDYHRKDAPHFI